ncbi:MAG: 2OG-Fe(II) oxygenase, partial [Flavobacteriales bacterium]|nr:2OG-Fe(II) oxygenase [Flavobacteriales bacterium]
MDELKKKIIDCLREIKGSGKFASIHTADFLFPGLEVDGVGEIAYPVNQLQAEALIKVARQAPFGKGRETIVDTEVRSVHEIDADRLAFANPEWDRFLAKAIENVKSDLGLEDSTVKPHLYKLLIYRDGDFFLPHKDSEKEKGMFGTLIIGLPAQHTGGELVISFDGARKVADFAEANNNHKIKYAAFYADCDHEVKPITSGFRVCLVYNLILEKAGETAAPQLLKDHAHKLADVFSEGEQEKHPDPYLVLLGHQYTPENFSRDALKLDDRSKAEALLQAAEIKGYYARLCLVTSYIMGTPEYDGYGYQGYDYCDEGESAADLEMGEVYDEDLRIEHWAQDELPGFNSIELNENDLITSFALDEGEPVEKENTGYMGNYGPDLMYWYHYGAVMVWSPEQNAEMILAQQTKPQLEWIAYFTHTKEPSQHELSAVEQILISGITDRNASQDSEDFKAIANWLLQRKSEQFLLTLSPERLQLFFEIIDAANWTKLLGNLSEGDVRTLLDRAGEKISKPVLEKFIGIIKAAAGSARLESIAAELTKQLPNY